MSNKITNLQPYTRITNSSNLKPGLNLLTLIFFPRSGIKKCGQLKGFLVILYFIRFLFWSFSLSAPKKDFVPAVGVLLSDSLKLYVLFFLWMFLGFVTNLLTFFPERDWSFCVCLCSAGALFRKTRWFSPFAQSLLTVFSFLRKSSLSGKNLLSLKCYWLSTTYQITALFKIYNIKELYVILQGEVGKINTFLDFLLKRHILPYSEQILYSEKEPFYQKTVLRI